MPPADGHARLLALYNEASLSIGEGPVRRSIPIAPARPTFVRRRSGSHDHRRDRPPGRDGHTVNETADLSKLPSQTKRAALLLLALGR